MHAVMILVTAYIHVVLDYNLATCSSSNNYSYIMRCILLHKLFWDLRLVKVPLNTEQVAGFQAMHTKKQVTSTS